MGDPKVALKRESDSIQDKEGQKREDEDTSLVTDIHIRSPPGLWSLQHFFNEISDDFTDTEFEKFKNVFKGKDGIGRGKLEKLTRLEMLDQLVKSNYIHEDSLLYLQAALPMRLSRKVIKYAEKRRGVLYFDPPLENPVAGHRSSNLYVKGKNFTTFTKEQLAQLVNVIKHIALVPVTSIHISYDNTTLKINTAESFSDVETCVNGRNDSTQRAYSINVDLGVQTDKPKDSDCRTEEIDNLEEENVNHKSNELQNELCVLQAGGDPQTSSTNIAVSNIKTDCVARAELVAANRKIQYLEKELKIRRSKEEEIRTLERKLELVEESLNNMQNEKDWYTFGKQMQDISKTSLTARKVYGNFDPSHEPITPCYNELFRQSFTEKIGRLFPQIKSTGHTTVATDKE